MPNNPVPMRVGISITPKKFGVERCAWKGGLSPSGSRSRIRTAQRLAGLIDQGYVIVGGELDTQPKDGEPLLIGLILEKWESRPTHPGRRKRRRR